MNQEIELEEMAPWLVILLTLIGGFLRVLMLASKGMGVEETISVWLSSHSVADLLQWVVKIEPHPPLYYLLLHHWITLFGDTPYEVRLLSALFGAGTIPLMYLTGKRISGAVMGLAAALILALSPFHIFFAQQTHMLTFFTFNAAAAVYALVRLLTDARSVKPIGSQVWGVLQSWRKGKPVAPDLENGFRYEVELPRTGWRAWVYRQRWLSIQSIETDLAWVSLIVFSAATLLSHNTGVILFAAIHIFVLGLMFVQKVMKSAAQPAFQAPSLANWVIAQVGILLLCSPWIPYFIQQASRVSSEAGFQNPTWERMTQLLQSLLNAAAPGRLNQGVMLWMLCIVLCLGLVYYRKRLAIFLFLAILLVAPFVGMLFVRSPQPVFYDRDIVWITIPLFLLLAAGIVPLKFRLLQIAAVLALTTIYLFSTADYFRFFQKEDWSTPAGYVALFAEEDDLVLFNANSARIPFDYYFRAYEGQYSIQVEKLGLPFDLGASGILNPMMTAEDIPGLIALLDGHNRVWLVYSRELFTDPMGLIPQTLAAHMELTRQRDFYGGQVQLYVNP
jgi:mannosyltransferase